VTAGGIFGVVGHLWAGFCAYILGVGAGAVQNWIAAAALLVAGGAAWFTRRANRIARQANEHAAEANQHAAEANRLARNAVEEARRSAEAAEQAFNLAAVDAERRETQRHEANGPQFDIVENQPNPNTTLTIRLRIRGGPPMSIYRITSPSTIVDGLSLPQGTLFDVLLYPATEIGEVLNFIAHLKVMPARNTDTSLRLEIDIESCDDVTRTWHRTVSVPITEIPTLRR
jgi:hypothetical protein